ncbi:hypothetical protein H0H93_008429 [Arthromyces matolae]|nr:hypothetical protein H0H93_008429 [Arthromyces matolae]
MALSMLAGGAECGPSNPLQSISKRFDQDRGLQQDHFSNSRAGSSREAFRSLTNPSTPDQDAARFFSTNVPAAQLPSSNTYDVSALRAALPVHTHTVQKPTSVVDWASDFALQQPILAQPVNSTFRSIEVLPQSNSSVSANSQTARGPFSQVSMQWRPMLGSMSYPSPALSNATETSNSIIITSTFNFSLMHYLVAISWDTEFRNQEAALNQAPPLQEQVSEQTTHPVSHDSDDLARTAGMLLDNVKNEQNPKFQNSQFLNLMRQLRDRDIIVEGNQMVKNEGQQAVDVKGKGRAIDSTSWTPAQTDSTASHYVHRLSSFAESARAELAAESSNAVEDANDSYFRQENDEYRQYWSDMHTATPSNAPILNADVAHWEHLQHDWDQFEATASGIKRIDNYQFQDNNPYLLGESTMTRQHMMHISLSEACDTRCFDIGSYISSVLQLEAAVQRDMSNAMAWFELGVKQQENEREQKAFQALRRSLDLDSSHLPTWLALGVSNTNESNRVGTFDAINEWVNRNERYGVIVQQFRSQNPINVDAPLNERYTHLINTLIAMARSNTTSVVDADTQIALAILLNTNEEYGKAHDCFLSALAVRPEDWLLYNRVGATIANSGRAEEALQYYYRALELNPGFNLGISCINLRRYEEAAQHILDALVLQDNDGIRDPAGLNDKRGVTTTSLWDSLKTTCLHMQRVDLATLCDRRDLEGFRLNFNAM